MTQHATTTRRPMNVAVARGSHAETMAQRRAGLPGAQNGALAPEALVPGIPPTPAHDLIFYHGKTIQHLTYTNFYVGGPAAWQPSDIRAIDQALAAAMSDRRLNNVMSQYFPGLPTTTFKPSQILPGPQPAVFSQGDVEGLLAQLHTGGKLTDFDLSVTVFNFILPRGTILNTDPAPTPSASLMHVETFPPPTGIPVEDELDSVHGLGGYHGSIHFPLPGGAQGTIYYAVGVYSENRADGTANGIPVFNKPWKNIVATFYHELNEARTDANVEDAILAGDDPAAVQFLGWVSAQGEECGDFPVSEAQLLTRVFKEVALAQGHRTVPVQFQYSNMVHGPEGPIKKPYHP